MALQVHSVEVKVEARIYCPLNFTQTTAIQEGFKMIFLVYNRLPLNSWIIHRYSKSLGLFMKNLLVSSLQITIDFSLTLGISWIAEIVMSQKSLVLLIKTTTKAADDPHHWKVTQTVKYLTPGSLKRFQSMVT